MRESGLSSFGTSLFVAAFAALGLAAAVVTVSGWGDGWLTLALAVLVAMGIATHRLAVPAGVQMQIGRSTVVIKVGDLFESPDHLVVQVNERFDSELGQRVERSSVHGQAISRLFPTESRFREMVLASLRSQGIEPLANDAGDHSYPIGSTAVVDDGPRKLFVSALTHADPETHLASADVPDLWVMLTSLWSSVRAHANGRPIAMTLIGDGLARIHLGPRSLLSLILASIERSNREGLISGRITVMLTEERYRSIDLRDLVRD